MSPSNNPVLSPAGNTAVRNAEAVSARRTHGRKPVIGLLNNSKPNVAFFLAALDAEAKARGYDTLNLTKPRSAGPCPDIDGLAAGCDFVINAVAD